MNEIRIADRIEAIIAKRIHVFENGDADSVGKELLINSTRERTWNQVLTHLTQTLKPSYGIVRHLISVDGKESAHSFSELNNGARYVACGKEQFKKIAGGYHTQSEHNHAKKKKCTKLYPKQEKKQEDSAEEYWALKQAQRNRRTVIYVFLNGLKHHAPFKFVLIDSDFRNWPRTLSHISDQLDKPEGIRYLYTVYGHRVCGPCELQHGACYVATAFGEKFQKLNYMDSYKDLMLIRNQSGETVKKFSIGTISSPIGFEVRNDDCFFTSCKGETKKHFHKAREQDTKRKAKKKSKSLSGNRSSKAVKSSSKKVQSDEIEEGRSIPGANERELQEEKITKATSTPLQDTNGVDEVTIEGIGIKIVSHRKKETNSQITQTVDNNQVRQNSKLHVVNTAECGLRIIGADELSRLRSSSLSSISSISSTEESEIINKHNRKLKEKLDELSKSIDNNDYVKVRKSTVSFSHCYANRDQILKDLKLTAVDDNHRLKNQRAIATPTVNGEGISSLIETKSVAIFERPEIILCNNNEYSTDDMHKDRIPVVQRRSTGFNICFGSNFVTPGDSDDDDDDDNVECENCPSSDSVNPRDY